jgi:hypothetical protein
MAKDHGSSVKDDRRYERLREQGEGGADREHLAR